MVLLASRDQVNRGEFPIDCVRKIRDVDLCQMHVYFIGTVSPGESASVDDRKFQRSRQQTINARFGCARIYKRGQSRRAGCGHVHEGEKFLIRFGTAHPIQKELHCLSGRHGAESLWSNIVPVHADAPIGGFGGGGANCGIILAIPVGAADAAGAAPERGPGTPVDALFLVDGVLGARGVCEQHVLSTTAPSFLLDADRQGAVRTRLMETAPAMGEAARVLTIGLTLLPYPRGRTPETVDTFIALHDTGIGAFTSRYSAFGLAAWQPYTPPWLPEPGVPLTVGHEYLLRIEIEAVTGRWNAWLDGLPVAFGCGLDDMIRVRVRPLGS